LLALNEKIRLSELEILLGRRIDGGVSRFPVEAFSCVRAERRDRETRSVSFWLVPR